MTRPAVSSAIGGAAPLTIRLLGLLSLAALALSFVVTDHSRAVPIGERESPLQSDQAHALQVIANLQARTAKKPLVLLLGNSIAREATVSDASWLARMKRLGVRSVLVRNIGMTGATFDHDLKIVRLAPARALVLIGVDIIGFYQLPSDPVLELPAPLPVLPAWLQHRYSVDHQMALAEKQALVATWVKIGIPLWHQRYEYNLGRLEMVVQECLRRGLRPVLLYTPINTAVVGDAFDSAVLRYRGDCRKLADSYLIPVINLVSRAQLADGDSYDIWHAVEPGRVKWCQCRFQTDPPVPVSI